MQVLGIISVRKHMVYNHRHSGTVYYANPPNDIRHWQQWAGVKRNGQTLAGQGSCDPHDMTPISVSDVFEEWKRNGSWFWVRIEEPQIGGVCRMDDGRRLTLR